MNSKDKGSRQPKVTKKRLAAEAAKFAVFANEAADLMKLLLVERVKYDILVDKLIAYCDGLRAGTVIVTPSVPEIYGEIQNHRNGRLQS